MSRINGEKARAAITRRNRTAQRLKDRSRLAELRAEKATEPASEARPAEKNASRRTAPAR